MEKYKFSASQKIFEFQKFIQDVYGLPDDRLFSLSDLVSNQERFTMRALKGIRKGDKEKLKTNLLIAFSWVFAIANRLKIDVENNLWKRFPYTCSYPAKRDKVLRAARFLLRQSALPMQKNKISRKGENIR